MLQGDEIGLPPFGFDLLPLVITIGHDDTPLFLEGFAEGRLLRNGLGVDEAVAPERCVGSSIAPRILRNETCTVVATAP